MEETERGRKRSSKERKGTQMLWLCLGLGLGLGHNAVLAMTRGGQNGQPQG